MLRLKSMVRSRTAGIAVIRAMSLADAVRLLQLEGNKYIRYYSGHTKRYIDGSVAGHFTRVLVFLL